jgi:hypothetical protein
MNTNGIYIKMIIIFVPNRSTSKIANTINSSLINKTNMIGIKVK